MPAFRIRSALLAELMAKESSSQKKRSKPYCASALISWGAKRPPHILFQGVLQAAGALGPADTLILLATQSVVDELSPKKTPTSAQVIFHVVTEVITMGDEPLSALRRKKGSSLVTGIRLLKKKQIQAFISTGNTGALIAAATLYLPMLPGIRRPALMAELPTEKGPMVVVDVGGNVSCKVEHLLQFTHMGVAYQRCTYGKTVPTVGLLNIGVESKKGTSLHCQAYEMLNESKEAGFSFIGNIEGRAVFKGKVDVLVTDGFTGNVLLKSIEGVSLFILDALQTYFQGHATDDIQNILKDLKKNFHHEEYPGAIVAGVDGVVVKCHGNSSARALYNGIMGASRLIQSKFVEGLATGLRADSKFLTANSKDTSLSM